LITPLKTGLAMPIDRRKFLKEAAFAGGALRLSSLAPFKCSSLAAAEQAYYITYQ
jgi:hypothetical protein